MTLIPGLVSVTFRQLAPPQIIELTREAGLQTIEWGGDVHVPHGDVQQAKRVAWWTKDTGLSVAAYGSYYRLATDHTTPFDAILDTALALEAPIIRVWAGTMGSADADEQHRQRVYQEAREIASLAAQQDILISFEFHDHTLTDTAGSARDLMQATDHPNLRMYWQPPHRVSHPERIQSLEALLPWLTHVHVFHWHRDHPHRQERYLLAEGESVWQAYLNRLHQSERDHALMLEFVKDDDPENFRQDAKTLLSWI